MPNFNELSRDLHGLRKQLSESERAFLSSPYPSSDRYESALRELWRLRESVAAAENHLATIGARLDEYRSNPYHPDLLASGEEGSYYDAATTLWFPDFPLPEAVEDDLSARSYNIVVVDASLRLQPYLKEDPKRLAKLSPEQLEEFVLERLESFGFQAHGIGSVYRRDGGVDIVAIAPSPIPYILVIQVKSHADPKLRTGLADAQRFYGVGSALTAAPLPCKFGLLVTNTEFTRPALEWMEQEAIANWLRRAAFSELCQWLSGVFMVRPNPEEDKLSSALSIPGGPTIELSTGRLFDGFGRQVTGAKKPTGSG